MFKMKFNKTVLKNEIKIGIIIFVALPNCTKRKEKEKRQLNEMMRKIN